MARTIDDFTGAYGQDWTTGILAEHVHLAEQAGVEIDVPILCGEIVEIWTEDGRIHGRCGTEVEPGGFACPGHTDEINAWRNMSEWERIDVERMEEGF